MNAPANPRKPFKFFPMGHCHHADFLKQSPPLTTAQYKIFMRGELKHIKEAGFNVHNMEFGWLDMEYGDDVYDWGRTDAVFELCQELDLPIFAWMFAELTPRWLIRKYPEVRAVAATGYKSETHSFGHPIARDRIRRWMHKVIERYGDSPLVIGYNVGIETGLFWIEEQDSNEPAARLWDYNPAVLSGFPTWLEKKYGTLDELNRIWRDHYISWDEIDPPNSRFIHEQFMLINQVSWLDWRLYMIDLLTDYVHFKGDCVRELKPQALLSDQTYVVEPAINAQNIWKINAKMDVLGTSMFVSSAPGEFNRSNYWEDYFRSSSKGKPYWIWELRSGQNAWGITNWSAPISAAETGRFTWQAIGQNVKSIQYWNWRPHIGGVEVGGHGFTERDGTPTDRSMRAGNISKLLNQRAEWFLSAGMPRAHIAILDSEVSRIIAMGEGSDRLVFESQVGAYGLFKSQGYYVEFVNEDEIQQGVLQNYKLLVVPFAYAMHTATGQAIKQWVGEGGFLFAGLWCGAKDGFGFGQYVVPGFGLDEVFGAKEAKLTPVFSEQDAKITNMFGIFGGGSITGRPTFKIIQSLAPEGTAQSGDTFQGFCYISSLKTYPDTDVIAMDERGETVAVRGRYGKGQGLMIGSFPIREKDFAEDGLSRLAHDFATLAGITRPVILQNRAGKEIEAKLLENQGGTGLLVLLNAEDQAVEFCANLEGRQLKSAVNLETDAHIDFTVNAGYTILRHTLAAQDAAGIYFEEQAA
jgi:beta-galactosidase GanA